MKRILTLTLVLAGILAGPAGLTADEPNGVSIAVEKRTFPVVNKNRRKPNRSPEQAAKLIGKSEYTTDVLVLQNRYLLLEIVPEFGGRVIRAQRKGPDGNVTELLWQNDKLINACSWSMGGLKWSFPHWEHGRKLSESAGYVILKDSLNDRITVAMDMRFDEFLTPAETKRYGLATTLRLAQTVTLGADDAAFDWSARVTNPMPIRCGFKLWYLVRPAMRDIHSLVFPATSGVGHNAPSLMTWNPDEVVGKRNLVFFAAGLRQPFAGWYYPEPDYNLMVIANRRTAPGGKQVLYTGGRYIELWGGNHEVFEEAGRMLPPLGAFEMHTRIYPATGIGKVHYANRHIALGLGKAGTGAEIRLVTTKPRTVEVAWKTADGKKGTVMGPVGPRKPMRLGMPSDNVSLRITDGKVELADIELPIARPPKLTDEQFRALQLRVHGEDRKTGAKMPGGKGMLAELTDLTAEHHYSLVRARGHFKSVLETSTDRVALLDAARRLMRVSDDFAAVTKGLEKVLRKHPNDPHANLYMGMALWETGKAEQALPHLIKAKGLPGGRYLLAMFMKNRGKVTEALEHAQAAIRLGGQPQAHYYGKSDPAWRFHQPGATLPATPARLLSILCLREIGGATNLKQAAKELATLQEMDPSLMEGWLLRGEMDRIRALQERNPRGVKQARNVLDNLRKGQWPGIGRPIKSKSGKTSPE